jgi:hypothetical protein
VSARAVVSLPCWVAPETMMTGVGRSFMIFSRKSRPFMPGISTSSVTTSGSSSRIIWRPSAAFAADATTSMSPSLDRRVWRIARMVGEILDDDHADRALAHRLSPLR